MENTTYTETELTYCPTCDTCTPSLPIDAAQECCICGNIKVNFNAQIKEIEIKDLSSVKEFLHYCMFDLGLNFHPDTPFKDYVTRDGIPCFNLVQCGKLNVMLFKCFKVCLRSSADIYELCVEVMEREEHIQALKTAQKVMSRIAVIYGLIPVRFSYFDDQPINQAIVNSINQLNNIQSLQS